MQVCLYTSHIYCQRDVLQKWAFCVHTLFMIWSLSAMNRSASLLVKLGNHCFNISSRSFEATVIGKAHYRPLLLHRSSDFHLFSTRQASTNQSSFYLPTELIWTDVEFGPFEKKRLTITSSLVELEIKTYRVMIQYVSVSLLFRVTFNPTPKYFRPRVI